MSTIAPVATLVSLEEQDRTVRGLRKVILDYASWNCMDPRDHIYAFVSLGSSSTNDIPIVPDCTLPVDALAIKALALFTTNDALFYLEKAEGTLELILRVLRLSNPDAPYSTWVKQRYQSFTKSLSDRTLASDIDPKLLTAATPSAIPAVGVNGMAPIKIA